MKIDVDTKERLKIILIFLLQSYKVAMGSMLILFVPQTCGNGVCSLSDNLTKNDGLHVTTLSLNFISLIAFTLCYHSELQRENWCVHHLDIDKNEGDNNLALVLNQRPDFKVALDKINNRYYIFSLSAAGIYFFNLLLSSIVLFNNSAGSTTLTSYLGFVLLILMKLYNSVYISIDSKKNARAFSAYMTEFQSFNVIDVDHRTPENGIEITEINIGEEDDDNNPMPKPLVPALEMVI
jgi:hypothetical protein